MAKNGLAKVGLAKVGFAKVGHDRGLKGVLCPPPPPSGGTHSPGKPQGGKGAIQDDANSAPTNEVTCPASWVGVGLRKPARS